MTVYEIPNIEHVTVTPVMSGETLIMYRLRANEGWYIHLHDDVEDTMNLWKRSVVLPVNYDFSIVEIRAEEDLPEDSEIAGVEPPTEEEYAAAGKILLGVTE